jgi:prophage regulatory protein
MPAITCETAERFLSYKAATQITSLSESTLRRLVKAGEIAPPVRVTTGRVAFRESDVRRWMKALELTASA